MSNTGLVCAWSGHGHAVLLADDSHPASSTERLGYHVSYENVGANRLRIPPCIHNRGLRVADSEVRPTDTGDGHPNCIAEEPSGAILTKTVTTKVFLPEFPASIDFGLLVDISESYE